MKIEAFDLNELIEKMEENDIEKLAKLDNVGIKTITNNHSRIIMINTTGEAIFIQNTNENVALDMTEHEIEYDQKGKPYFRLCEDCSKEYLNEYIRKNYPEEE